MNRDKPETAQNAAGADNAPVDTSPHAGEALAGPAAVSASRSGISSEAEPPEGWSRQQKAPDGPPARATMSRTRREAFEPLIDWMAKRILDMLLEEKRIELEAERTAQAGPAAPR